MAKIKVPKAEEAYINDIYNRQKKSTLRTLKSAYDSNVASIDTAKKALDTNSYEAKREAAGDAAITRQRLNEAFAANGLNTGAVGQANLALLNQKAANLNKIDLARQQAQQEYDAQKAALMQAYQAEVKSAIQQNNADKARALYAAWKEQQAQANALALAQTKSAGGGGKKSAGGGGKKSAGGGGKKVDKIDIDDFLTDNYGAYSSSVRKQLKKITPTSNSSVDQMIRGLETIGTKEARFAAIEQAYKEKLINKSARDSLVYKYAR